MMNCRGRQQQLAVAGRQQIAGARQCPAAMPVGARPQPRVHEAHRPGQAAAGDWIPPLELNADRPCEGNSAPRSTTVTK